MTTVEHATVHELGPQMTADGLEVAATLPAGSYTLRKTTDGGVQVIRHPMRTAAEIEARNRDFLERTRKAGGAPK